MTDIEAVKMSEAIRMARLVVEGTVHTNALKDPTYCPYCMRCSGLIRMKKRGPFSWACDNCGAGCDHTVEVALLSAHALIEKQRAVVDCARLFVDMVESAERQRTVRGSKGMGASLPGEPLSYIQPSAFGELWKLKGLFSHALDTLASVGGEEGSK